MSAWRCLVCGATGLAPDQHIAHAWADHYTRTHLEDRQR